MLHELSSSTGLLEKEHSDFGSIYALGQFKFGQSSFYADNGFGEYCPIKSLDQRQVSTDFEIESCRILLAKEQRDRKCI